jgi:hypothetical protein
MSTSVCSPRVSYDLYLMVCCYGSSEHRAKDFLPLIQAIYRTVIEQNNTRVYRAVIGQKLRSEHDFPIGTGKYRDFKTYSYAAAEFGYVVMGTENTQRLGHEWIESTGKLEAACGGESCSVVPNEYRTS